MLSLLHRFHGHNSLRPLYQKGSSVYSRNVKLLWLPAQSGNYRASVVVSKKVHKSAVVRNRIRRRIYETTRVFFAAQPASCDLVFIVQNATLAAVPAAELQTEVAGLLMKLPAKR